MQKIVIKLGLLAVMLLTAIPAVGQRATIGRDQRYTSRAD